MKEELTILTFPTGFPQPDLLGLGWGLWKTVARTGKDLKDIRDIKDPIAPGVLDVPWVPYVLLQLPAQGCLAFAPPLYPLC